MLQLQEEYLDAAYVYHATAKGVFTSGVDETSTKSGYYIPGHLVTATERHWSPQERDTIRIKAQDGWASELGECPDEGHPVHQLVLDDPHDHLRWHLRRLRVDKLHHQAMLIGCDAAQIAECTPQTCPDAGQRLIELITHRYHTAEETMDLKELPDGWAGSEAGLLKGGDRIEVRGESVGPRAAELEKDVREERKALNKRRGYVIQEVGVGSYEVQLDRLRVTYIVERANLRYIEFDETKPTTLFATIVTDDVRHFRRLLTEQISSKYCPTEAIETADGNKLETLDQRIELCRNAAGSTLYDAAKKRKSWYIAAILRHHLLFKAVRCHTPIPS